MTAFIETQFPIARLSTESYKERKAGASQILTRMGKWWGRKPLILVRAAILGMLMPASGDAKALLMRLKVIGSAKRTVSSQFFELIGEAMLKRKSIHMRYLILRHADQVSITSDTGAIKETVRKPTQQAWDLHCSGSFQLIDPGATIGREAKDLRQAVDKLRKVHTRVLNPYGSITLRSNRQRLEAAVKALQAQVATFAATVHSRLQKEIDHSRKQLVQSVLPGLKAKPPEALLAGIVGKPTVDQITRWIDRQLDQAFPKVDDIVSEMRLVLTIKAVTFEMLKEPKFQDSVRDAYPDVDFDKPFSEFTAARSTLQPNLDGLGR